MQISGFLNLNKPKNFTSHDCVGKLRRLLQLKKIGHGGTLDPLATGVLPIAVGNRTRLLQFLPDTKTYIAKICFGIKTNTEDLEGEVLERILSPDLTLEDITYHLPSFLGEIEQIPPAFSAIKQGGTPLYKLARKGENVEVPKRIVKIEKIEVLNWFSGDFPELDLKITCGGGTYIRSIARDLGILVKKGATLANLQRVLSGGLTIEHSLTFEEIECQIKEQNLQLISPETILRHLPLICLEEEQSLRWCQGQKIWFDHSFNLPDQTVVRVYDQENFLLGVGQLQCQENRILLKQKVVLL